MIKNAHLSWPRIENDDYLMSVGSYRPLEDAARIAYNDMVRWVAANYSKVPKKYLPPGEVMNGMHRKLRTK